MSDGLQRGDRVLDLRAVCRSSGLFVGLVAAPLAAGMSHWRWVACLLAAIGAAVAGFVVGTITGRAVFPAPQGQTVVARVGPPALGLALRASLSGGLLVAVGCAAAAFLNMGLFAAAITLLAGVIVSLGAGSLAALV